MTTLRAAFSVTLRLSPVGLWRRPRGQPTGNAARRQSDEGCARRDRSGRTVSPVPPGVAQSCGTFTQWDLTWQVRPTATRAAWDSLTNGAELKKPERRAAASLPQTEPKPGRGARSLGEGAAGGGAEHASFPPRASLCAQNTHQTTLTTQRFSVCQSTANRDSLGKRYGCTTTLGAGFVIFHPNQNCAWEAG